MSSFTASVHRSVHSKVLFFCKSSVSGFAMWENPGINAHWYPSTPSVLWTSLTDFKFVGHSRSPDIFDGSGCTVPSSNRIPRYSMRCFSNLHFFGLRNSEFSLIMDRTVLTTSLWYVRSSLVAMRISSMYPWTSSPYRALLGQSSLFIILWKVAGAFLRPKFITIGSYCPKGVLNAPFGWSPSQIQIWWDPHRISNFVNKVFPWSFLINGAMSDSSDVS